FTQTQSGEVNAIAVQRDGRIIIGGSFWEYSPIRQYYLTRLDATGHEDPSFQARQIAPDGRVRAFVVQADDSILIPGQFYKVNETQCIGVARLLSDGTVDRSFRGEPSTPFRIAPQRNGGVLIAGSGQNAVARLLPDGSKDGDFAPGGLAASDS